MTRIANVCLDDEPQRRRATDEDTRHALHRSQVIDLTTTGRRTGQPRRIEIFLHYDHGLLFISGVPRTDRTRDWIHNITADPHVAVHLKQSVMTDISASARVVTDAAERRPLMEGKPQRNAGAVPTWTRWSSTVR